MNLIIGGIFGFVTASWATHIAYFVPFDYWQWKSKLWFLQWNPHCEDLKDKKIRQELAWKKSIDRVKLNESMD